MSEYYVDQNGRIAKKKKKEEEQGTRYSVDKSGKITVAQKNDEDIAPVGDNVEAKRTWFQSGAFDDGYQAGDVLRTAGATLEDVSENLFAGVLGMGEKVVDTAAYLAGGAAEIIGTTNSKRYASRKKEFIAKDLYDEETIAKKLINGGSPFSMAVKALLGYDSEEDSVLGEKSDALAQSAGQLGATVGLQMVGVPWFVTSGVTSFGGEVDAAFKDDASYAEAGISAAVSAGAEILTEKLFGGSGLGEKGLIPIDKLTKGISNKIVKSLLDFGLDMTTEGAEEVVSSIASRLGSSLYKEESAMELLTNEEAFDEYLESFIGGFVLGGGMNVGKVAGSLKTGRDYRTNLTNDEQAVVDKEIENRIKRAEADGSKLTPKQKTKIAEYVRRDLEEGSISIDTIEEALGGDSYDAWSSARATEDADLAEYNRLEALAKRNELELADKSRLDELKSRLKDIEGHTESGKLRGGLRESVMGIAQNSPYLSESYAEAQRATQKLDIDETQYKNENARKTVENIKNSGLLGNTKKSRRAVETLVKLSEEKGMVFSVTDDAKMRADGTAYVSTKRFKADGTTTTFELGAGQLDTEFTPIVKIDGKAVTNFTVKDGNIVFDAPPASGNITVDFRDNSISTNGYIDKNTGEIVINVDSPRMWQFIVGHEITHGLEGTKEYKQLAEAIKKYREMKGDYGVYGDARASAEDLYNEGTDIDAELNADIVGEYLFTDEDFVNHLSVEHRNLFEYIFDQIKYFANLVTAGSAEARQLEVIKHRFEAAYRAQKNTANDGGVQYALADIKKVTPSKEQISSNIQRVSQMPPVHIVDEGKLLVSGKDFKEIYGEYFAEWGENIHTEEFGDIAAKKSSIRSEIRHGSTAEKTAAIEAIPSVIKNGKIVDWIEKNPGSYRIIVAAPISIGETPYMMGVMLQRDSQYQRLYIHDVVIEKEASSLSQDDLIATGSHTENDSLFLTSILQKILSVKSYSKESVKKSLSRDTSGRELTAEQTEYFKDSKVRDESGSLKVVYHGSGTEFTEFSYDFMSSHGSSEGQGFYFTDSKNMAAGYQKNGAKLMTGYLDIKKPLSDSEITIKRDEVFKLLKAVDPTGDDVVINYDPTGGRGYPSKAWYNRALAATADALYNYNASDSEILADIANSGAGTEAVVKKVRELFGYDGYIVDGKYDGATVYVAFESNQFKSVDNLNPTDNPDINRSLSDAGKQYPDRSGLGTPMSDLRIKQPDADIAPVAEDVTTVSKKENVAPTATEESSEADNGVPKSDRIADGSRSDELLLESPDNHPVQTVEQRVAEKIRATQGEIEDNKDLRREAEANYESQIASLRAQYNAKKNKNTKTASHILQSISRLERLKASTDADFAKRISDLEARVERMSDPKYNRALVKQDKMQANAKWAEDLIGNTTTWKDKKLGVQYATNTERRNLRDIVRDANGKADIAHADSIDDALNGQYNREQAEKNRELTKLREKYAKLKITKAEDAYIQMLGELRSNPETTLTEQAVKEYYEKHKGKIDTAKVDKVIEMARQDYDELLVRVNAELKKQGMKEIPYRKGYFPHFTNPKQNIIQKLLNWKVKSDEIPTSIAGLTEDFKPTRTWQSFDKTRHTDETDYSFLKGFDSYSDGALDWIYHMDTLQKRRAVENYIRYTHSEEGVQKRIDAVYKNEELDATEAQAEIEKILAEADNPLNNFIQDFTTHTNILAGKKNSLDRAVEQLTGRGIYNVMANVQNRTSTNAVLANVRSALTNFIPITQSWAQVSPLESLKAVRETIANAIKDDGMVNKSAFLTNRLREADKLYQTNWDKVLDKAGIMFGIADTFSSQVIWRSKYNQNIKKGMSEAAAIANADQFAENVMAGRSKGNEPTLFNAKNPLVKAFTMFQLEVNNQYGYFFKDVPIDLKAETEHWKLNLAKGYTTAFIGAYVYNALLESVTGSKAAFDPIRIVEELFRDLGMFDDDEEEDIKEAFENLKDNILEEMPFVGGYLGGGRIPISNALPIKDIVTGKDSYGNEKSRLEMIAEAAPYTLLPFGYGQIKKTVQGLNMFSDEHPVSGSYTDSGNLRFPVEDTPLNRVQAAIFGQYASKNAREYFDNDYAPLKEKQIQEYIDVDIPIKDYWDYREGLAKQNKLEDKFDYIAGLDLPVEKKNILVNNIVDRKEKVDLTNYDDFSDYEEFDFATKNPEKYEFLKENGLSVDDYNNADEDTKNLYSNAFEACKKTPAKRTVAKVVADTFVEYYQYTSDINSFKSDKDENGNAISGSAKAKKVDYINGLDLDYGQKIILYRSLFDGNADRAAYDDKIVEYLIDNDNYSYEEKVEIFKALGFDVSEDGTVSW